MIGWPRLALGLPRLGAPVESRHPFAVDLPAPHTVELLRQQRLARLSLVLCLDGEAVWQLRIGSWAMFWDLLAALAGLAPISHGHTFELEGRRCRLTVWPSLGLGAVTVEE